VVHLSSIWIPLISYFWPRQRSLIVLGIAATGTVVIDVLRLWSGSFREIFYRFIGPVVRGKEAHRLTGASYMMFSCFMVLYFYGGVVTAVVCFYLVLGDTAAALVGLKWGKIRIFKKTLIGSLACFTVCFIMGLVIPEVGTGAAFIGALVATLVELLPLKIDDNVLIPLVSGGVLYLIV
jgi:dolichol kinase